MPATAHSIIQAAYNQEVKVVLTAMLDTTDFPVSQVRILSPPLNHKSRKMATTTHENIVGTIRDMKIGDAVQFPIEKTPYIRVALYSRLLPERKAGCRWSTSTDNELGTVTVRRTG